MISNEGDIYPDYSRKAAATAQPVPPPQKQSSQPDMVEKIGEMIEKFSEKMAETERQLRTEMDDKLNRQIAERQSVLENLYKQEQLRYEKEIQELKVRKCFDKDSFGIDSTSKQFINNQTRPQSTGN